MLMPILVAWECLQSWLLFPLDGPVSRERTSGAHGLPANDPARRTRQDAKVKQRQSDTDTGPEVSVQSRGRFAKDKKRGANKSWARAALGPLLDTHADGAAEGDRNGQFPQRIYSRRLGPSRPLLYRAESSIASITGLLNTILFASRPMENCTCNQSPLGEVMGVSGARQKLLQLSVA